MSEEFRDIGVPPAEHVDGNHHRTIQIDSELLADVGHQLRNQLNAAIGAAGLLAAGAETSEERELAAIVEIAAEQVSRIVDDEGWWYYKGRKKESMRRLGENISAWEIETVVNQHPAVLESGAHAVKSDLGEDEVKVVIVPQPGTSPAPEAILDFCKGKMAHYAVPRYVEFVDALPKTETHRIQYAALKARGVTPETWDREAVGYKVEKV